MGRKEARGKSGAPEDSGRVVVKLSLDRETVRRLKLESFGRDCSLGQVVEELVRAAPRRFVLTDRGKGAVEAVEAPEAAQICPAEAPARPPLGVVLARVRGGPVPGPAAPPEAPGPGSVLSVA